MPNPIGLLALLVTAAAASVPTIPESANPPALESSPLAADPVLAPEEYSPELEALLLNDYQDGEPDIVAVSSGAASGGFGGQPRDLRDAPTGKPAQADSTAAGASAGSSAPKTDEAVSKPDPRAGVVNPETSKTGVDQSPSP